MARILFALVLLCSSIAHAGGTPIIVQQDNELGVTGGACASATSLTNDFYTGWLTVEQWSDIVFELTFVDANSSITELTMTCWTSRSKLTANGSGFKVVVNTGTSVAGKSTFKAHTWSWGAAGSDSFEWVVTHPRGKFLNCKFSAAAGTVTASIDTLAWCARGATP